MVVSSYGSRKIVRVEIVKLRTGQLGEDELAVAEVVINVADAYTAEKVGPGVKVNVGLLPEEQTTVRDLERAALSAAHDLLKRIADEPFDELFAQYQVDRAS